MICVIGSGLICKLKAAGMSRLPKIRVLTTLGFELSLESPLLSLLLGSRLLDSGCKMLGATPNFLVIKDGNFDVVSLESSC